MKGSVALNSKSIQFKLVGVILLVIAVAITGLAGSTYLSTREVVVSNIDQQLRKDANGLADDITLWLNMKKGEVAAIAASPVLMTGDKAEILRYITAEVKRLDDYELILVGDAKGDYYTSNNQAANNADREYFKSVMSSGENYVSDPLSARTTRNKVVIVAAPIVLEGKVIGVVGGSVKIESIEKKMQAVKLGKTGYAYLVQANGLLIAHPDQTLAMKKNLLDDSATDNRLKATLQGAVKGQVSVGRYRSANTDKEQFVGAAAVAGTNNWVVGMTVPVDEIWEPIDRLNWIFCLATLIILLITGALTQWFLSTTVIRPLVQLETMIESVAQGDLTARGKAVADDELGRLTLSFNQTLDTICEMIGKIHEANCELKPASMRLQEIARMGADNSLTMNNRACVAENAVREILTRIDGTNHATEETGGNITNIAAAVQEMAATTSTVAMVAEGVSTTVNNVRLAFEGISGNTDRVSQNSGDMSNSVEQVVNSVQDINRSIGNVKLKCERSVQITLEANDFAQETSRVISQLSDSTKKINKIVSIINNIASQTNMLALNAAIEAASAGEAGKGFAVVAGEVKELAQRTARATDEIGQQLEEMQNNMSRAVESVGKITQVIVEITDITGTIGNAINEQSATLTQITGNSVAAGERVKSIAEEIITVNANCKKASKDAADASRGVAEIAQSITELSDVTTSIARNVESVSSMMASIVEAGQEILTRSNEISTSTGQVTEISENTSALAADTMKAADGLAETATKLDTSVKVFKV